MTWKYGMRLRGFSIGCQPMKGLLDWEDTEGKYHSILTYDRKLTDEEVRKYELDPIDTEPALVYTDAGGGMMPTSEALKRAVRKYDDANTVQLKLKLNKKTDADILQYLESHPNKQGLIKQLIRAHMSGNP